MQIWVSGGVSGDVLDGYGYRTGVVQSEVVVRVLKCRDVVG